jgi:hypothetical protein
MAAAHLDSYGLQGLGRRDFHEHVGDAAAYLGYLQARSRTADHTRKAAHMLPC